MNVHPRACVCIINKRQKANSLGNITWSELGKQNIQGKKCIRILRSVLSKMGYSVWLIIMFLMQKIYAKLEK